MLRLRQKTLYLRQIFLYMALIFGPLRCVKRNFLWPGCFREFIKNLPLKNEIACQKPNKFINDVVVLCVRKTPPSSLSHVVRTGNYRKIEANPNLCRRKKKTHLVSQPELMLGNVKLERFIVVLHKYLRPTCR
jgi:hypothetical protein